MKIEISETNKKDTKSALRYYIIEVCTSFIPSKETDTF
jgi:hypothetical protein